jgi:hypothetical protein
LCSSSFIVLFLNLIYLLTKPSYILIYSKYDEEGRERQHSMCLLALFIFISCLVCCRRSKSLAWVRSYQRLNNKRNRLSPLRSIYMPQYTRENKRLNIMYYVLFSQRYFILSNSKVVNIILFQYKIQFSELQWFREMRNLFLISGKLPEETKSSWDAVHIISMAVWPTPLKGPQMEESYWISSQQA